MSKDNLSKADAVIITTDHSNVDYEKVGKYAKLVIDTRNIMANVNNPKAHILRAWTHKSKLLCKQELLSAMPE